MNKIKSLLVVLALTMTMPVFGQVIDTKNLSPEAKRAIEEAVANDKLDKTINKYSEYGAMAEAFGVAINKGLGAFTENVEEFSQTSAGKLTIAIIAFKVMGVEVARLTVVPLVMCPLLVVYLYFWYSNGCRRRILVSHNLETNVKQYETTDFDSVHNFLYFFGMIIIVGVMFIAMFA